MTEDQQPAPGGLRLALDTNILVYAEGIGFAPSDADKIVVARGLLDGAVNEALIVPRQVLAELQRVLVRKAGFEPREAALRVRLWTSRATLVDTDDVIFEDALDLAAAHSLQIFDAIVLAAAAAVNSDLLISEDFQDGFVWRGVTITNPFGPRPDPWLERMLSGA